MTALPIRHRSYQAPTSLRRRENPYFNDRRADRISSSPIKNLLAKLPPRFWLWFFIFLVLIGGTAWLLFFSNVFIIKNIEVRGASLIPSSSLERMAYDRLERRRAFVFSEEKLAVFHSDGLSKDIQDRYPLNNLRIIKRLPSTIIISLEEKSAAAVWFEGDVYYQVDSEGWLLAFAEGSIEGYPTIFNIGSPKINGKRVEGMEKTIAFARDFMPEFSLRFSSIALKQLSIDNDINTIKFVPKKGAMIFFSTDDSLRAQLDRLGILLNSELKDRYEKLHYIDLRFKDKIYYK